MTTTEAWSWRSPTTGAAPGTNAVAAVAMAWRACGNESCCSVVSCPRARGPGEATGWWRGCRPRPGRGEHPGRDRRRSRAGARGLPGADRGGARPGGGRRGRRRSRGHRAGPDGAARRGPDGHPDARDRRGGRDQPDHQPPDRRTAGPGSHLDHIRPRRVRIRGAARRGQRLPAQGHAARRTARRHPDRRGGRRPAGPQRHPQADPRVRPPGTRLSPAGPRRAHRAASRTCWPWWREGCPTPRSRPSCS